MNFKEYFYLEEQRNGHTQFGLGTVESVPVSQGPPKPKDPKRDIKKEALRRKKRRRRNLKNISKEVSQDKREAKMMDKAINSPA